jgi:hypothetical protein
MAGRARVIEFVGGDHANRIPLDVRRSVLLQAPQCTADPSTYEIATAIWSNEQIACDVGAQLGSLPEG